jgi:hypothetical protein
MTDKALILLLQIVRGNGDLSVMIKNGYDYSQIADFLSKIIKANFVEEKNEETVITKLGTMKLKELNNKYARFNSEQWISPDDLARIPPLTKSDIYIPRDKQPK